MRTQRRAPVRLRLTHFTDETLGDLGDVTGGDPVVTVVEGATFDPERSVEAPRELGPQTTLPAVFNVPGAHELGADDLVEVLAPAGQDNPNPIVLETWDVDGVPAIWRDRTKIPVTRTAVQAVGQ